MAAPQLQDSDIAKSIKHCFNCSRVCIETLSHCLANGKSNLTSGKHLSLLQSCADSTQLSARMMTGNSPFHHQACELSFELCLACAAECERFQDDKMMQHCAETCRLCAESCRASAGMTVTVDRAEISGRSSPR